MSAQHERTLPGSIGIKSTHSRWPWHVLEAEEGGCQGHHQSHTFSTIHASCRCLKTSWKSPPSKIQIPSSRPYYCVFSILHVFLPLAVATANCELVDLPNTSICRNICFALLTLTPKLAFCPRQMFGHLAVSPKLAQIRPILASAGDNDKQGPAPLYNPQMAPDSDPTRWKIFSDANFFAKGKN